MGGTPTTTDPPVGNLSRQDHDVLIRLETKMDAVDGKVTDIKENLSKELAKHEIRIQKLEDVQKIVDLPKLKKEHDEDRQWVHDFKLRWKFVVGALVLLGGVIQWILSNLKFIHFTIR